MDSGRMAERLAGVSVPPEFVLVDEWNVDGNWLLKPRKPEAARKYVARGSVEEWCDEIDLFYSGEFSVRATQRSDDPPDWCGRSLQGNGRFSIWVEPVKPWVDVPTELEGVPVVQLTFWAQP